MADYPDNSVEIRDFPGLVTQVDPHDAKPGVADKQVNMMSDRIGVLRTRPGIKEVTLEFV